MTIDLRPAPDSEAPGATGGAVRGPFRRVVVGSLALGAVLAAAMPLVVVPGAVEHVTTGAVLVSLAAGWAALACLTTARTDRPQHWAYVPAAFFAVSGLLLLALAPGDDALAAAAWVWPPVVLVLVVWCARRARASMPGRSPWLVHPALLALSVAAVGALAEDVSRALPQPMGMPGALHDVGGHRLHLQCTGEGSPTVVLESGLGGNSRLWARIAAGVVPTTRVCSYDRAGTGWSDDAARPQDSTAVVADLHALLAAAGERAPYVLVGHSTGGVYAMTYAATHPEQVAGLVLLDSSSPRQFTDLPDFASQYPMLQRFYGVLPTLNRLGIGRLVPGVYATRIPGDDGRQASAFLSSPRTPRTAREEVATFRRSFAQAQALTSLGSKPLVVLSASDNLDRTPGWRAAQQQLAGLSSNAQQRDVEATHEGLLDHPVSSVRSIDAIHDVVRAARTGGSVSA